MDELGELMVMLEVYKILYNRKYTGCAKAFIGESRCIDKCSHSRSFLLRQEKEYEFHIKFWNTLCRPSDEYIPTELLKSILILIYGSSFTPPIILMDQIDSLISLHVRNNQSFTAHQLIIHFKQLNPAPFFSIKAILLKSKLSEPSTYNFSPSINSKSQALDEIRLKKYAATSFNSPKNFSVPCKYL